MTNPLRLIAQSGDDMPVVSALLQDMTVRVEDMAWLPAEKRFACVGNRYIAKKKWGIFPAKGERVRAGFHIRTVKTAKLKNIDPKVPDTVLALLAIEATVTENDTHLTLSFSGGASVALTVETIDITLTDLSEPWQAIARPHHA